MIQTHSIDPDVEQAATAAREIIAEVLAQLPLAEEFDYGGHELKVGEYDVCRRCTQPIAEAQAAEKTLLVAADLVDDEAVKEHIRVAARLFHAEAEAAVLRAELHNGHGTEAILNELLAFHYNRQIGDDYSHSHHGGKE